MPIFTPSRIPLPNQRWTAAPRRAVALSMLRRRGVHRSRQVINSVSAGLIRAPATSSPSSAFDGFNHLPRSSLIQAPGRSTSEIVPPLSGLAHVRRRCRGADAVVHRSRAKRRYFTSSTADADDYVLYVVQLERQTGEWLITGGYAGEAVTRRRASFSFAPDRGLTRSIVARAWYTIDPNRSVAIEGAVRENGDGLYARGEYSWARGQHWRTTVIAALLAGSEADFLGQYNRNSHLGLSLRYSF